MTTLTAVVWCLAGYLCFDALRRRQRLQPLRVLRASPLRRDTLAIDEEGAGDYRVWVTEGAEVPQGVVVAAIVSARNEGLVALDIVPTDWPGLDAWAFANRVDIRTYRDDRLAVGVSAACALVASTRHLSRLDDVPSDSTISATELAYLSERLKILAPDRVAHRAGPGVSAPNDPAWSAAVAVGTQSVVGWLSIRTLVAAALWWLGVTVLAIMPLTIPARVGLLAALMSWLFQPAFALGGGTWSPNDLSALLWGRPFVEVFRSYWLWRYRQCHHTAVRKEAPEARPQSIAASHGMARSLTKRSCPMCAGVSGRRFHLRDRWHGKEGTFGWVRCECGTAYAERELTAAEMHFYWDRPAPGLGRDPWSRWHRMNRYRNEDRTRLVHRWFEPLNWLDIYCGDGAFGAVAGQWLQGMDIEGVDPSDRVHEAVRRRWLARGHRGRWEDVYRDGLKSRRYDAISAWHGLERVSDPLAVLSDVQNLLTERGVFALESTNPDSLDAKLLGARWLGWNAPYHLQSIPPSVLLPRLKREGWRVLSIHRRRAHRVGTFTASWILSRRCRAESGTLRLSGMHWRVVSLAQLFAGLPLAMGADALCLCAALVSGQTNVYRVLALPPREGLSATRHDV